MRDLSVWREFAVARFPSAPPREVDVAVVGAGIILGKKNPWRALFDPHRKPSSLDALKRMVVENADYPLHWVGNRLATRNRSDVDSVTPEGLVVAGPAEKPLERVDIKGR